LSKLNLLLLIIEECAPTMEKNNKFCQLNNQANVKKDKVGGCGQIVGHIR